MLTSLPPATPTGSMVTSNTLFAQDSWAIEGPFVARRFNSSVSPRSSMSSKDVGSLKKRESRSGTRKVSALSAEQLERKRANDREAQRSIRQRTKEHIEQLENLVSALQMQVAELRPRSARYDALLQRNASLEDEISRLKQQMATMTGRPALVNAGGQPDPYRSGWTMEEGSSSAASDIPATASMLSNHFPGASNAPPGIPRAVSSLSASSRSPHPRDWPQQYSDTRSPSLDVSSEAESSARMDPYLIDGQVHQSSRMEPPSLSIATSSLDFSNTISPTQNSSGSSFSQIYPLGQHQSQRPEDQSNQFYSSQQSMSIPMPSVTAASAQPTSASYAPLYPGHVAGSPQRDQSYPYPWIPQP